MIIIILEGFDKKCIPGIYALLAIVSIAALVIMLMYYLRLRSRMKLEKNSNEIRESFFTGLVHELCAPLTLILGGIDEIGRRTPEGDRNEYSVRIVRRNAKRMLTLVNRFLDTRSIADGKIRLKVSHFDIVKLVQDVYDDFRDMSVERNMEFRMVNSVDSLMVWGDALRLESLVYNLLSNAFKYTSDGGKIEVGVLWREGEKEFRIIVKDNGAGISKQHQKRIFEPYRTGETPAFRGKAGAGIGLSFCKEIADMHGGGIWVESTLGIGSKFFVKIPVGKEESVDESAQAIGDEILKVEPAYLQGALTVLIVNDNAELKISVFNSLSDRYEVRDASNGREALDIISSGWLPDIMVTDLMMPEMDAMELRDHIRNDFADSHIPVIVTADGYEDDTYLKAMKYGADGYIAKPFTMELLAACIDNMLGRRKVFLSKLSTSRDDDQPRRDEQLLERVMVWLEENVSDTEVTVDKLAAYVGMGRTSMYNKIKDLTGKSPLELIQEFRMEKAINYLNSGQFTVSEISCKVGFSDPGYFSRSFRKHFGMSPSDYMKQNRCTQIRTEI